MQLDVAPTSSETGDPSWKRWTDLVELGVAEARQPGWAEGVRAREARTPDEPLLHRAMLRMPQPRAQEYAVRLAGNLGIVALESVAAKDLIRAGIERDHSTLEVLAGTLAVSVDTVALLGQLCALPLLLNAAGMVNPETSRTWQRGYCPVCGGWPSMVEMRGIQRERRMRCGGCGSDWLLPVLHCAFCGEIDHQKLGSLLSEGGEHHVRVETCKTCHGYLKSITTLGPLPFATLAAKDMSTIAFDLAAQERGYARPTKPGWPLRVEAVQ